jgi:hypothetical protein
VELNVILYSKENGNVKELGLGLLAVLIASIAPLIMKCRKGLTGSEHRSVQSLLLLFVSDASGDTWKFFRNPRGALNKSSVSALLVKSG